MISTYYLSLFLCGVLISVIGGWIATMPATRFWMLHTALMGIAAAILIVVRLLFGRLLAPSYAEPKEDAMA